MCIKPMRAVLLLLIIAGAAGQSFSAIQTETALIAGEWDMEVSAGDEVYYLTFTIEETEEGLKGSISESSGYFSDVPLENITFDGTMLRFEMTVPTPPDGYESLVKAELELVEGRLEGILTVEEMGLSATAVALKR